MKIHTAWKKVTEKQKSHSRSSVAIIRRMALFFFFLGACAQLTHAKKINENDGRAVIAMRQSIKTTKSIEIDVQSIPLDDQPIIAPAITLSLATDTLDLLVHSSAYLNYYPDTIAGDFNCGISKNNKFRVLDSDLSPSSLLSYDIPPDTDNSGDVKVWHPLSTGTKTLTFYGDLVVKSGIAVLKAPTTKHVVVQVPVTIVE